MHNLPKFSIHNYQFVIIVFAVLLIMGINSFLTMPRTEDPPVATPGAIVTIVYPGANPNDMEELVVNRLEEKINGLENIEEIRSTMGDGFAMINISFEYGSYDFDKKFDEVVQQVNTAKNDLPSGIRDIGFRKKTTTDTKILQLAMTSGSASFAEMKKQAEILSRELEVIRGIKATEIAAVPDQQVKINMDSEKMMQMGITADAIINAIYANNQNIPGGEVVIGTKSFNIKTSGSYQNLDEIRNTVVGAYQGQLIYLKNVAEVSFDNAPNNYMARFNQQRSIFISAEQKAGMNVLEIIDEAHETIEKFSRIMPENMEIHYVHNQAESVKKSVNGFISNLVQGILVVGLVVMLAIGFRSSMVVIIAIPASILIGLGFVDLAGFGLQSVSIAALVIALGLLVDNSIVVIENAERYMQQGLNSRDAAIKGTSQVAIAITSSTLTTLAAFLPIALLPDAAGEYIRSLPVTVVATLSASLLMALTVSPLLLSKIIKTNPKRKPNERKLQKLLKRFIEGPYRKILHYSLHHTRIILFSAFGLFVASIIILKFFVGVSFFPKAQNPKFMITATLPQGSSLEASNQVAQYVESVLDTLPAISHFTTNVGHGNPKVYFNYFPRENAKNFAEFYVVLNRYDEKEFTQLIKNLRVTFENYAGADILVKEFQQGLPVKFPIEIVLYGNELETLMRTSEDFERIFATVPGIINTTNELEGNRTDLYVNINKDKAAMLGVPVSTIDKTIRLAMNGITVSQYRTPDGEEYDIVLQLPVDERAAYKDFEGIYVPSLSGRQIPLSQLAHIEFTLSPSLITHYNLRRSALIGADVATGYNTAEVTQALITELNKYEMPSGTNFLVAGESAKQSQTFGNLGMAAAVALLIILAILVLQFRSFSQPLIIFVAIPLALTGSFFALFLTGYSFSFTGFIGAVALIGIAINNAILLIDFTNELRREGKPLVEALMQAGQIRFTPIIITSFTTIGGLLPLTLQGGLFWGPLGWTIIGGLTLSTFMVLIVVPVLYKVVEKKAASGSI